MKQIIFQFTLLGVVRGSLVVAGLTKVLKVVTVTDMHLQRREGGREGYAPRRHHPPSLSCCHLCLVIPATLFVQT